MKKYADVQMSFTVAFDDDGESALNDQAMDAAKELLSGEGQHVLAFAHVMGEVRATEEPTQ